MEGKKMKAIDKEKISVEFGTFVREARERKGLYQADVAEKLGVSRSYYAFIEGGQRDIYLTLAVNLCRVLDLNINDFMTRLK
jgi:transcriptional regulator with XRE-family HTH domain